MRRTKLQIIWVDINYAKIVCWVRRRTLDASNQSTKSDQKAVSINFLPIEAKYCVTLLDLHETLTLIGGHKAFPDSER